MALLPQIPACRLLVPLSLAGLLLVCRPAGAQIAVDGPPTPAAHALTAWFGRHIPAKFAARGKFVVRPLSEDAMDDYLDDGGDGPRSDDDDGGEIDGVFVNHPPQIVLRVPGIGGLDYYTFAHEYGHYVWFDLMTDSDRKRYKTIYEHQKAAHRLVTDYAAVSLEEGFAEAFAADITDPAALLHWDTPSYQFLAHWTPVP